MTALRNFPTLFDPGAPLAAPTVALWPFHQLGGEQIDEVHGHAAAFETAIGTPPAWQDGGLHLDGNGNTDTASVTDAVFDLSGFEALTIAAVLELENDAAAGDRGIVAFSDGTDTNKLSLVARRNATGNYLAWHDTVDGWIETATELPIGREVTLVVTAEPAGKINFYVDGPRVASLTKSGAFPAADGTVWIGRSESSNTSIFEGTLRLLWMLNRAIEPAEASRVYADPFAVLRPTVPLPLAGFDTGGATLLLRLLLDGLYAHERD